MKTITKKFRIITALLIVVLSMFSSISRAQSLMTEQVYNPDVTGIENNPMKGWMPGYTGIKSTFPYNVDHFYISLKKVYTNWGQCDWTEFDKELNRIVGGGRHVVCRFWVHYPNADPVKANGLPAFLSSLVPAYSDGSPDYNDEDFMLAMEDFIKLFGAKYNNDPRILLIEAGLNGKWGEWHTYPNDERAMNQTNKNRLTTAYLNAFPNTHIGIRQSGHVQTSQKMSFAYYDDSWAHSTLCTGSWCFWNGNIVKNEITNIYQFHPIAGEMRPEVQLEIFDLWPNPSKTTEGQPMEDLETCIKTTHVSFMKAYGGLYGRVPSAEEWANGLKSHKMLGYQFYVRSVQILPEASNKFTVNLNLQNKGVAPIYYNWQVEFSAINSANEWIGIIGTADWNTNSVMPTSTDFLKTFTGNLPASGNYKILMRFKNPLDAYTSNARVLRFANEKQDADKNGWLTLGTVNTENTSVLADAVADGIRIYPNPVETILNIEFSNSITSREIKLYSTLGKLIYSTKTQNASAQIKLQSLNLKGIILVQVISDNTVSTYKVVIQ